MPVVSIKRGRLVRPKKRQHFGEDGEGKHGVYAGSQKGQEEDGEDLGVDGLADLCLGHAHLLAGCGTGSGLHSPR